MWGDLGHEAEEVIGGDGVGGGEGGHGCGGDGCRGLPEALAAEVGHDEGVHLPQQLRLLHRLVHCFALVASIPPHSPTQDSVGRPKMLRCLPARRIRFVVLVLRS